MKLRFNPAIFFVITAAIIVISLVWSESKKIEAIRLYDTLHQERDIKVLWQDVVNLNNALKVTSIDPSPVRLKHLSQQLDIAFVRIQDIRSLYNLDIPQGMTDMQQELSAVLDHLDSLMSQSPPKTTALKDA